MKTNIAKSDRRRPAPVEIFSDINNLPGAVWLDSSLTFDDRGINSFIAHNPAAEIIWENDKVIVRGLDKKVVYKNKYTFFDQLERLTQKHAWAIGFISYEAALPFLGLDFPDKKPSIPLAHFNFYDTLIKYDNSSRLINNFEENKLFQQLPKKNRFDFDNRNIKNRCLSDIQPVISRADYVEKINTIKNYIREGDIYQANFTTRFDMESNLSPYDVYLRLRYLNPAPYSAFLNFGDYQIISSSPERMFKKEGDYITSSPIKGTIERGKTKKEIRTNINKLLDSDKDKAELLMITDLVRNDLGKIAQTGSVKVDKLFKTEVYSSLIHLVSDISGRLDGNVSLTEIFKALLPGGSITGAPKKRAVEIINEVEHIPRSVYTGCIGIINKDCADFNIAIRTMIYKDGFYQLHAGGGIVADSNAESEYDEMLLKAKNLIRSLGIH